MIADGLDPLIKIDAWGNWWHGSYDTAAGFRSRAGVAQPVVAADTDAQTMAAAGSKSLESHLVDFGMPTQATPSGEAAAGLERWNKAILVGSSRLHSILSTDSVGTKAWLYRAPDGQVWTLQPSLSGATITVQARRLRVPGATLDSWQTVCTRTESAHSFSFFDVNASPDGSAAAMRYLPASGGFAQGYPPPAPHWIVEFAVSGGSVSSAPTVTAASTSVAETVLESGTASMTGASQYTTSTNAPVIYPHLTSPATRRLWTQSKTIALASSATYTYNWEKKARVVGVAWKSDGTRLPIRYITGDRMTVDGLVEYAVSLPLNVPNTTLEQKWDGAAWVNCAPGELSDWTTSYGVAYTWPNNTAWYGDTYYYRTLETFKTLEIGGSRLEFGYTNRSEGGFAVYVDGVQVGKSDSYRQSQGFPTQTTGLVSGMNPATQQPGNGATYWYPVPQAVAVVVDPAASPVAVWGYVHPEQAHWYGSGSPQNTPRFAVNPETGAFAPTTTLYY